MWKSEVTRKISSQSCGSIGNDSHAFCKVFNDRGSRMIFESGTPNSRNNLRMTSASDVPVPTGSPPEAMMGGLEAVEKCSEAAASARSGNVAGVLPSGFNDCPRTTMAGVEFSKASMPVDPETLLPSVQTRSMEAVDALSRLVLRSLPLAANLRGTTLDKKGWSSASWMPIRLALLSVSILLRRSTVMSSAHCLAAASRNSMYSEPQTILLGSTYKPCSSMDSSSDGSWMKNGCPVMSSKKRTPAYQTSSFSKQGSLTGSAQIGRAFPKSINFKTSVWPSTSFGSEATMRLSNFRSLCS
mmetsp:Transcript_152087/g.485963  ORF Transcript_152087/g.485963 Transcript_152087/m.485963 type:complete len:299 (+) Transcript_152087:520-1416(+)